MQVPQTVQMTYWSHQHFFGSHHSRQIPPSSEGKKTKKNTFSSLHHSFALLFSGKHKSVWCLFFMGLGVLGAPATSIWPINHVVVSSNRDTRLSSRIIEVEIGFLPTPNPPPKKQKNSFLLFNRALLHFYDFLGKKWGFQVSPDSIWPNKTSSAARLLDPTLCETRRPNVRSPLGGGILNPFLWKDGASKGPRCSRETWRRSIKVAEWYDF